MQQQSHTGIILYKDDIAYQTDSFRAPIYINTNPYFHPRIVLIKSTISGLTIEVDQTYEYRLEKWSDTNIYNQHLQKTKNVTESLAQQISDISITLQTINTEITDTSYSIRHLDSQRTKINLTLKEIHAEQMSISLPNIHVLTKDIAETYNVVSILYHQVSDTKLIVDQLIERTKAAKV